MALSKSSTDTKVSFCGVLRAIAKNLYNQIDPINRLKALAPESGNLLSSSYLITYTKKRDEP